MPAGGSAARGLQQREQGGTAYLVSSADKVHVRCSFFCKLGQVVSVPVVVVARNVVEALPQLATECGILGTLLVCLGVAHESAYRPFGYLLHDRLMQVGNGRILRLQLLHALPSGLESVGLVLAGPATAPCLPGVGSGFLAIYSPTSVPATASSTATGNGSSDDGFILEELVAHICELGILHCGDCESGQGPDEDDDRTGCAMQQP